MTIVHLEPEEFAAIVTGSGKPIGVHCIVLDSMIGAMIYTCHHGEYLYYMDRISHLCFRAEKRRGGSHQPGVPSRRGLPENGPGYGSRTIWAPDEQSILLNDMHTKSGGHVSSFTADSLRPVIVETGFCFP